MVFSNLIDSLLQETTTRSIPYFGAELCLSATIVLLLLFRLLSLDRWVSPVLLAITGSCAALLCVAFQFRDIAGSSTVVSDPFFTGLLVQDLFSVYFRGFLAGFLMLTVALTSLTGIPDEEDGPDFYSLLIGATIGMMLMATANNLLILFIGVEMASVPSYAMVGFLKGRKPSSEAALKYVIYGAGAAGVMLYGISLLAGVLGTADMSLMAVRLSEAASGGIAGLGDPEIRAAVLGILLIMVGLAFKLSLVPFHFWCPDAFEGAPAEVAGFLSIASKAAAFALLVRFCLGLSGGEGTEQLMVAFGIGIGVVACVSTTFGNLAAYAQTNLKRLLAYSTIAHAGYMVMAVSAMMVLANSGPSPGSQIEVQKSIEGLLYYLVVYLFMNLGAFGVVALARNYTFSEEIDSFKGLITQSPVLCVTMLICFFSLVGLPPFGGFFAKLMIFGSLIKAGELHWFMYVIVVVGALNTVISLVYYIRVLKTMFIDERPADMRPVPIRFASWDGVFIGTLGLFVLLLGVFPSVMQNLTQTANSAAESVVGLF
jgi:NADH-quinone oxidoreductase subunit N